MKSPGEMPQLFCDAWNRRDADGIADLFATDADFVNVTGIWWSDRPSIRKAHDYGLRVIFSESHLSARKTKVKMLGDSAAVVHARMLLSGQSPHQNKKPGSRNTIFSFVMLKKGELWECVSAQNTDVVPGRETHFRADNGDFSAVDYRSERDN